MNKTLLLVFVHGFQGDDNTFEQFPTDLAGLTSHCLPQLTVLTKTYPCYATRGDLSLAVQNLRTWLQDLVIDLESRPGGSPHPTTNPSVRTILVCHSMGGIVSADVLLGIIDEPTVSGKRGRMMFPYIQGIIAFDTPFLGLAPSMFAHNVDAKVKSAGEVVKVVGAIAGGLWGGLKAGEEAIAKVDGSTALATRIPAEGAKAREEKDRERDREKRSTRSGREKEGGGTSSHRSSKSERERDPEGNSGRRNSRSEKEKSERPSHHRSSSSRHSSLVGLDTSSTPASTSPATTPKEEQPTAWSRWGKLALYAAGAASIAAAGTAASIYKREEIVAGFSWATSHLEFVSELYKSETLKTRLSRVSSIKGVGFANIYTSLGVRKANSMTAPPGVGGAVEQFLGMERTFCSEPQKESAREGWYKMVNKRADNEIAAHTGMFNGKTNLEYFWMRTHARDLVVAWAEGWK